jgi:hypothetical protein
MEKLGYEVYASQGLEHGVHNIVLEHLNALVNT